jgi:hypothetical protein
MTIKQLGGVFGRNPTFNDVTIEGQLTFDGAVDVNSDLTVDGNLAVTGTGDFDGDLNVNAGDIVVDAGYVDITHTGDRALRFQRDSANTFSFEHATDKIYLWNATASHAPILIQNDGNIELGVGNLKFNTAGKGIDFSATAGTGTSELFDDYEEGTWTPTISSGATSITYGTQDGHYTKIGQMVFFRLNLTTSAATADANQFQISGLPFTATTSAAGSFAYTNSALINSTTNNMPLAYITGSVINLFTTTGGNFNGTSATNMAALNIYISGCYIN